MLRRELTSLSLSIAVTIGGLIALLALSFFYSTFNNSIQSFNYNELGAGGACVGKADNACSVVTV